MGFVLLDELSRASADEAAVLLAGADPVELIDAVRSTPDPALVALIERDEILPALTAGILGRLDDVVEPDALTGITGTARLDLEHRGRLVGHHELRVTDGALGHQVDVPADHPATVVLRTTALRFVRLVSGELNAGLEYLGGTLDIIGDAHLALALGGMFRSARDHGARVDPRALDPVEVAGVLGRVSADHLRSVMASDFRHVVLDEVFRRLPAFVNVRKASGLRLTVGFRITGRPDGEVDRYVVTLADNRATVTSGPAVEALGAEARNATVTCDACDFLRLVTGHIGAVTGVLRGQLKVRGDKTAALRLNSAFDIPTAVA